MFSAPTRPGPVLACPCCSQPVAARDAACRRCGLMLGHPLVVTLTTGLAMAEQLRHQVSTLPQTHAPSVPSATVAGTTPAPTAPPAAIAGTAPAQPASSGAPSAAPAPAPARVPTPVPTSPLAPTPPLPAPVPSPPTGAAATHPAAPPHGRRSISTPSPGRTVVSVLQGRSVGWLLLAVGASCLAAAAFIFVVVAWRWMPWPLRASLLVVTGLAVGAVGERVRMRSLREMLRRRVGKKSVPDVELSRRCFSAGQPE